jgi:hypothetical protein
MYLMAYGYNDPCLHEITVGYCISDQHIHIKPYCLWQTTTVLNAK